MSTTFSFVCDDCKVRCWAGQNTYIYAYDYIAEFLHEHTGHNLRFLNDHIDDDLADKYEDCDETNKMATRGFEKAVKDAATYVTSVADDRGESPILPERADEVVKIIDTFFRK